jgi:hypothetical protein
MCRHCTFLDIQGFNQKNEVDILQGKLVEHDPKLLEAKHKLQQLQDAYAHATQKYNAEEEIQHKCLVELNKEAVSVRLMVHNALGRVGEALISARDSINCDGIEPPAPPTRV